MYLKQCTQIIGVICILNALFFSISINAEPWPNIPIKVEVTVGENHFIRKPFGNTGKNHILNKPLGVGEGSVNTALGKLSADAEKILKPVFESIDHLGTELNLPDMQVDIEGNISNLRAAIDKNMSQSELDVRFSIIRSNSINKLGGAFQQIGLAEMNAINELNKLPSVKGDDVVRALRKIREGIQDVAKKVVKDISELKVNIDRELTKAKSDLDSELTHAKNEMDNGLTKLYANSRRETDQFFINLKTEWNYFGATLCGENPERKKIQRQYDQRNISKSEKEKQLKNYKETGECSFGGDSGGEIMVNGQKVNVNDIKLESESGSLDEGMAFMRKIEMQEIIDSMPYSFITGWIAKTANSSEDMPNYAGIIHFETIERNPAGDRPVTRLVPVNKTVTAKPVIPNDQTFATLFIKAIQWTGDLMINLENEEYIKADTEAVQMMLKGDEMVSKGLLFINGRYQQMVELDRQYWTKPGTTIRRVDIYSKEFSLLPSLPALTEEEIIQKMKDSLDSLNPEDKAKMIKSLDIWIKKSR